MNLTCAMYGLGHLQHELCSLGVALKLGGKCRRAICLLRPVLTLLQLDSSHDGVALVTICNEWYSLA